MNTYRRWLYYPTQNITLRINAIRGGWGGNIDIDHYILDSTNISEKTFYEIIDVICQSIGPGGRVSQKKRSRVSNIFRYLRISKITGKIVKSQLRLIIICSMSICPECGCVNCILCKQSKPLITENLPSYITCIKCEIIFRVRTELISKIHSIIHSSDSIPFIPYTSWQCPTCKRHLSFVYQDFLEYIKQDILPNTRKKINTEKIFVGICTPKAIGLYQLLSEEAQADLENDPRNLSYSLRVATNCGKNVIIPPFTLLMDYQHTRRFYEKLIQSSTTTDDYKLPNAANIKTTFGTVTERMEKGKYAAVRQYSHNTRYVKSGRAIIVPYNILEPDECVLPANMWRRLECPRIILAHRYPTLNDRNFTVHRVIGTWIYPTVGIPTSIVYGHNADFDGDAMQIIPLTNPGCEAEANILFHPAYNMIIAAPKGHRRLRLTFDHDEILTLYRLYGINGDQIHAALFQLAINESSEKAYTCFCQLRKLCRRAWECHLVFPVTYSHVLDYLITEYDNQEKSYAKFVERNFHKVPSSNTIKQMIISKSSRFSLDHLWQLIGVINVQAPSSSFLGGMTQRDFIDMAKMSRLALIKDIAYAGYGYLKLLYCTRTLILGYDGRIYTIDGELVANDIEDIMCSNK